MSWMKLSNNSYVNMNNGYRMHVRPGAKPNEWRVSFSTGMGMPQDTIEDGYQSEKEAQEALDEFISEKDLARLNPPQSEEEKEDNENLEVQPKSTDVKSKRDGGVK